MYGDHGPYVEFNKAQLNWTNLPVVIQKSSKAWYDEFYTTNKSVKVYEQKRDVSMLPNPPKGAYSSCNNRKGGYADYKIGMYYISPDDVITRS